MMMTTMMRMMMIAAFHVYGDQELHDVVRQNCMNYIVCE
jgi:hypothetical protein